MKNAQLSKYFTTVRVSTLKPGNIFIYNTSVGLGFALVVSLKNHVKEIVLITFLLCGQAFSDHRIRHDAAVWKLKERYNTDHDKRHVFK